MSETSEKHCPTCICGRRAPVQGHRGEDRSKWRGPGTISWAEHLQVWSVYAEQYGAGQSAERMAQRGGFGYEEIKFITGEYPKTWEPLRQDAGTEGGR